MREIRLYVTTTEARAEEILDLLSAVFGEEDFAIGT
ncbi:50S ribosomal protein L11 methyltransferase, partial [Rhizobium leguminosarum]